PWYSGLALAGIYLGSLLMSTLVAGVMGRLAFRRRSLSLLAMELPAYRTPQWKPIFRMTWSRASTYLRKAGTPIVIISAVLWLLSNYGLASLEPTIAAAQTAQIPTPASDNGGAIVRKPQGYIVPSDLNHSIAAQIGQLME